MRRLFPLLVALLLGGPALAGQATCREYLNATVEDQALFNGYIFGYVSAKLDGAALAERSAATTKVRDMTNEYCRERPGDNVEAVIMTFGAVVAHSGRQNK